MKKEDYHLIIQVWILNREGKFLITKRVPRKSMWGRKKWGADTGARHFYEQRNEKIKHKYFHLKVTINILCDEYNLSDETIRKTLYR